MAKKMKIARQKQNLFMVVKYKEVMGEPFQSFIKDDAGHPVMYASIPEAEAAAFLNSDIGEYKFMVVKIKKYIYR